MRKELYVGLAIAAAAAGIAAIAALFIKGSGNAV